MLNRSYLALGAVLLTMYALIDWSGWEFGHPDRQHLPADVRGARGGYRSFHFWHSGYLGGK